MPVLQSFLRGVPVSSQIRAKSYGCDARAPYSSPYYIYTFTHTHF